MKAIRFILAALLVAVAAASCGKGQKTVLFNGQDMEGWYGVIDMKDTTSAPVFFVQDSVLCISGRPFGYMRTEKVYGDYKAHLEFRWVGEEGTNSGFFHRIQEGDQIWPNGVECQMCAGKLGDFVGLNGAKVSGYDEIKGSFIIKHRIGEDNELPVGEWNSLDVQCKGTRIRYYVNGKLQNECDTDHTSGYIGIQSEGGPLQVRNFYIVE